MSVQVVEELAARLGLEIDGEAFAVAEKLLEVVRGGMVAAAAAGAAVGAAVLGAAVKTAAYADEVEKASQRTGIAVESLQALQYAAERADVGTAELEGALRFAAKRGVKDLEGELRRAAAQFERMPDGAEKSALAMKLFGKNGAALIPMLNGGAAGLDEMTQKARDMGLVLDEETIAAGAELKDAIEDIQGYLRGLVYTIAGPFLKPIREALERFVKWLRDHRPQIQRAFDAIGSAVGTAMKYAAQLIEPVIDILWRLGEAILSSTTGKVVSALAAFGFALTLPFAGPVIAIGALLMALEELWGWITGERDTALEDTFGPFADFKKDFTGWLSFDASDSPMLMGLKGLLVVVKELFGYLRDSVAMWEKLLSKGNINPGFNTQNAGGGVQYGLRTLFGDKFLRGVLSDKGQEALYEGSTFAVPPQFQAPTAPSTTVANSGGMNLQLNVTAPAGVDATTWADQLAGALQPHLERFVGGQYSGALPAAAR